MIGEIIAIGDELTSGRITNTTSGLAARELFLLGHEIRAIHTIGDEPELIGNTLQAALARADFVIVTGGLGATTDDLTTDAVVQALHLKTGVHPGVLASLKARLSHEMGSKGVSLAKLAELPEGAEVLDDDCRMAGYLLRYDGKPIYFLPGVPPQMEMLLHSKVLPGLQAFAPSPAVPVCQQVYRTCGLQEVAINELLLPLEQNPALQVGYYPVGCEVHISLTLRTFRQGQDDPLFLETDTFIRQALGKHLYGTGNATLASVVGQLLIKRGIMLSVAESCTGGLIASKITETPGSSQWFGGGVIVYSNEVKKLLLNINPAVLAEHGAVSAETARAMAVQAGARLNCDIAVSATGIAGPDGGTIEKPVGMVYLALYHQDKVSDRLYHFTGSRRQIQEKTAHTALDLVRRALLEN
jgi:nicotinamide-nucleotide amidase